MAAKLAGTEGIRLVHDQLIYKPPDVGQASHIGWHQDLGYWTCIDHRISFTCGLMMLRYLFLWWPFHPAGYGISLGKWNMNWYWFSIFVSWLLKLLILRLGQVQAHRRAIPFFMGLVLGEFMVGGSWGLLGIMLEQPMYRFMP